MEPRELLRQLMKAHGLNSNSLAAKTNGKTKQPQIHRFLSGEAKEPKRSTLEPIALYFKIPVDALFDKRIASEVARQKFTDCTTGTALVAEESNGPYENSPSLNKLIASTGINIELIFRLIEDLGDIPNNQLSSVLDNIHQQAELARAAAAHFAKKGKMPEIAAKVAGGSSIKTIKIYRGDGNPNQAEIPLATVDDPFSAEPCEREAAWYGRIEHSKKTNLK